MYKAVVFDVDGTLFDTSEGIHNCINYVLELNNMPLLSSEQLDLFIGPPISVSFQKYCGLDVDTSLKLAEMYRFHYVNKFISQSKMYADMKALLERLKNDGCKIAIATFKTQIQIDTLLKNEGLLDYFDAVIGVRNSGEKKADIIRNAANSLNVSDMKDIVMIGDSYLDAEGALNSGADFIGVTYGYGLRDTHDLNGFPCKTLCKSVAELNNALFINATH